MNTPLQISIALHYWTRAGDFGLNCGDNNFDAPAVRTQRKLMVDAGLLIHCTEDDQNYRAGPALESYVDALCCTPWPGKLDNVCTCPRCGKSHQERNPMPLPDRGAVEMEEMMWKATGEVRWFRPRGGTDSDIKLEQLFERATGERDWRPVRTVLAD